MMTNVLNILDIIPWTGEFEWFVIESFYTLDLKNFKNFSKILKKFELGSVTPLFPLLKFKTNNQVLFNLYWLGIVLE